MNRKKVFTLILGLTVVALIIACQKQGEKWKGAIEEIDGVVVVKNPDIPLYGEDVFQLEEELSISEIEGEEFIFSEILAIAVDDLENIFVLDFKEANIKVFSAGGNYLRTIGKKGEGPGELSMPFTFSITPHNELMIHDGRNRRLSFFSLEGDFIKNLSVAKVNLSLCFLDNNHNIIGLIYEGEEDEFGFKVKKLDSDCNVLATFLSSPLYNPRVIRPFAPRPIMVFNPKHEVIYSYPEDYTIRIFDNYGNEIKRIEKEFTPVSVIQEHIDMIKEQTKSMPDDLKLELSSHYAAFVNITLDDEGRIFVNTFENTEEELVPTNEVFDSEGRYIAKISLNAMPLLWKRGKLYTIEEDEEGFKVVKRYKVTWNY